MKCIKGMTFDTCPFNPLLGCDCGYNKPERKMKVLFLDVDGVLNNDTTEERCNFYTGVDLKLAALLVGWLTVHRDVKIVLSSTWRNHPEMHYALKDAGIEWIDITADINSTRRGLEISNWLLSNKVEKYAILDDQTYDFKDKHVEVFVQTDPTYGLRKEDLMDLSRILID